LPKKRLKKVDDVAQSERVWELECVWEFDISISLILNIRKWLFGRERPSSRISWELIVILLLICTLVSEHWSWNCGRLCQKWIFCGEGYTREGEVSRSRDCVVWMCSSLVALLWHHWHPHAGWELFIAAFLWHFKPEYCDILPIFDEEDEHEMESKLLTNQGLFHV
jgi:hypothetical protein